MENNTGSKTKRPNKLWLIPLILVILLVSFWLIPNIVFWLKYGGMPIAAQTVGFAPDCIWSGTAVVWIDENQNGQFEASEQPLQNVVFHVSDGGSSTSNWKGEATLSVWLPGCPQANFEIYPEIPNGYKLTTSASISADARDLNKIFEFGFNTLEGIPTATARPSSPTCTSYQIGIANQYDVSDIAIAADGSIWAATFGNGVVHYISEKDEWIRYTVKDGLISDKVYSITTLNNGDIWFAARGGASVWNGSNWSSYTVADGIISGEVFKVAQGYDNSIWFATEGGVSRFIPSTGTWTNYTTNDGLADNFITYVMATSDNSIWLPTATEGLTRLILPTSDNEKPQWITYSEYSEGENYIPVDYIDRIQVAPDGTYWFAGLEGLLQYDPISKKWNFDENKSNIGGYINSFAFGHDGSIWIASGVESPEIYHLNNQNIWEVYDSRDGLPTISNRNVNEDGAEDIVLDLDNNVWVATRETATRCTFSGK
jgi:ligand-binding sensor domain-containing protein